MARGKLKYRDVVAGSKQKSNRNKKHVKSKKTYSLYKKDYINEKKRKYEPNETQKNKKRPKFQTKRAEPPEEVRQSESEEDYEDDEVDALKKLRETFSSKSKSNNKSAAIDSDSDESDDEISEEEEENELEDEEKSSDEDVQENVEQTGNDLVDRSNNESSDKEEDEVDEDLTVEEVDNVNDPFVKHLFYDLSENMLNTLQSNSQKWDNFTLNWSQLGKLSVQIPHFNAEDQTENSNFQIEKDVKFAPVGVVPTKIDSKNGKPSDWYIKKQIVDNLMKANSCSTKHAALFTALQEELFSLINNYQDLLYSGRTFANSEEIRYVYCLHAVNHILKTRTKVLHHNAKLAKRDDVPEDFRDQGLVRPKILIVLPFKCSAFKTVNMIIDILLPENKGNVMNKKRFVDEYTGNELVLPKKNPKPEDYELTFSGNTSDDFRMGITVTKKSVKLYANFYSSDIIVASPLGLRTIIGAEGEAERDFDFMASIELLIFDQTELFLMQNWDHILHLFKHLHLQPKESHGTDFSRVRTWSLNGWSKYYRQTLIFASFTLPEINSVFNKNCYNYWGRTRVVHHVESGSIRQVFVQLPHVFRKFEATSVAQCIDQRFDYFVSKILPQQKDTLMKQTLIYVSNYFDYVRLRNYFKKEDIGFVQICEYSKEGKIARARDMFYHGDAHFLLYTERHHFFNRIRIKGIRHLVFYQPPNFPHFYCEMCNFMQEANLNKKVGNVSNMTVTILYSKYDVHQLAGIVGTEKALKMLQSDRNVHMMLTGAD